MSTRYTMTGRLSEVTRLRNNYYGNPRWQITLVTSGTDDLSEHTGSDCEGDHLYRTLRTASDAAFNYEVGNKGLRVGDVVTVTMNGRGTIDDMVPA